MVDAITLMESKDGRSRGSECPYGALHDTLVRLIVSEIAVLAALQVLWFLASFLLYRLVLGVARWRPVFQVHDLAAWLMAQQSYHWLLFLLNPYFVVVSPLVNTLILLYLALVAKKLYTVDSVR